MKMKPETTRIYQDFIRFLAMAMANMTFYSSQHPQVVRLGKEATAKLKETMGRKSTLVFLRIEEDLVVESIPLEKSVYLARLIGVLRHHGIEHLSFSSEVTAADLLSFIASLVDTKRQVVSGSNITVGQVEIKKSGSSQDPDAAKTLKKLQLGDVPQAEIFKFAEIYEEIKKKRKLHVKGIGEIVACFIDALRSESNSFLALASIRMMDEYTFTHSTNVCILNLAQALALNIDGTLLHDIGVAAMLHDVGKLFVPEDILCKPGKLTDEEWQLIQQHPAKGAQYLLDTPGLPPLATVTAFEHHRKYNGGGYPAVSGKWELNLCSQMTSISDIFDAMRTKRSYRDPLASHIAVEKIAQLGGTELHPGLTKNFLTMLNPYLESGENESAGPDRAEEPRAVSGQS